MRALLSGEALAEIENRVTRLRRGDGPQPGGPVASTGKAVHGTDVVEFFSSYEDAIKVGYDKFKLDPFLSHYPNPSRFVR